MEQVNGGSRSTRPMKYFVPLLLPISHEKAARGKNEEEREQRMFQSLADDRAVNIRRTQLTFLSQPKRRDLPHILGKRCVSLIRMHGLTEGGA